MVLYVSFDSQLFYMSLLIVSFGQSKTLFHINIALEYLVKASRSLK